MIRAQTFFRELYYNQEMNAQHMDGLHFITESLYRLWQAVDNGHKPSARNPNWRAQYESMNEAKAYEDLMKSEVFDVVSTKCILLHTIFFIFF